MCYSAMVTQDLKSLARRTQARVDYAAFEGVFARRHSDTGIKVGKALEANFYKPVTQEEERIRSSIDRHHDRLRREWETALFGQRKRLADAERILSTRATKRAEEDQRIATNKIAWFRAKLADLDRDTPKDADSRIFPFWYAPVIVSDGGEPVIRPMRYHCRPHGKPESCDRRFDGLYNARRDNLEGFWKNLFGAKHAIVVATSFYENVALNDFERRELREGEKPQNLVLHFNPKPTTRMLLACLWDRWSAPGKETLESFAAITDEPPPEVAATGHNRCVIPLREENVSAWLNPSGRSKEEIYALLDDRERPYYEHRLAA